MAVVTEARIRSEYRKSEFTSYRVEKRDILTPSARQFLQDRNIQLLIADQADNQKRGPAECEVKTEIQVKVAEPNFICANTGAHFQEKPVTMTALDGSQSTPSIISKTAPCIVFQGQLELLEADVLMTQVDCKDAGNTALCDALQKILKGVRKVQRAHQFAEPLSIDSVLDMTTEELRKHKESSLKKIDASMGRAAVSLNRLRARIRETELAAIRCFKNEYQNSYQQGIKAEHLSLIEILNALSNRVQVLMRQL